MATNITDLSFDETEGTLAVVLRTALPSSVSVIEAEAIEVQDHGVMADYSGTRYFVPWENILAIQQSI